MKVTPQKLDKIFESIFNLSTSWGEEHASICELVSQMSSQQQHVKSIIVGTEKCNANLLQTVQKYKEECLSQIYHEMENISQKIKKSIHTILNIFEMLSHLLQTLHEFRVKLVTKPTLNTTFSCTLHIVDWLCTEFYFNLQGELSTLLHVSSSFSFSSAPIPSFIPTSTCLDSEMLTCKSPSCDRNKRKKSSNTFFTKPSVYHALIVIFLEFFAFGLLTAPMITVLNEAFPRHTFLMNGLIQGVKGFLSFLSAPFIGSLSDVFGRKPFLLITVTLTCSPIPLMNVSHWWYFTMVTLSGVFAVTFSVVFAYVADITSEEDRSWTYGLVSATFAASLVTSPAIGAYLGKVYSDNFVIALASAVALLDIFFILACVPESLPEKCRPGAWGTRIPWEKADPFRSLKRLSDDHLILMLCIATFLSYLPEAGEYSCFFVYLRLVMGFSEEAVALFIAVVGITSCLAQTLFLSALITHLDPKRAIIVGLGFEALQLSIYGLASDQRLLWFAGITAGMGSITYPAISAFVSNHAEKDQQGVTQGVLTGIRGLCNGVGPAVYGLIFYIFNVDLTKQHTSTAMPSNLKPNNLMVSTTAKMNATLSDPTLIMRLHEFHELFMPGPPFAFGAILVFIAILVTFVIPENPREPFSITVRPLPLPRHRHSDGGFTQVRQDDVYDEDESLAGGSDVEEPTVIVGHSAPRSQENRRRSEVTTASAAADSYIHSTSAAGKRFLHFWLRWRDGNQSAARPSVGPAVSVSPVAGGPLGGKYPSSGHLYRNAAPTHNSPGVVGNTSVRRPLLGGEFGEHRPTTIGATGDEFSSDEESYQQHEHASFHSQERYFSSTNSGEYRNLMRKEALAARTSRALLHPNKDSLTTVTVHPQMPLTQTHNSSIAKSLSEKTF